MFFGSGWGAGGSWFVLGVSELGLRWSVEVEGDDEGEVKLACSTPAYDAFGFLELLKSNCKAVSSDTASFARNMPRGIWEAAMVRSLAKSATMTSTRNEEPMPVSGDETSVISTAIAPLPTRTSSRTATSPRTSTTASDDMTSEFSYPTPTATTATDTTTSISSNHGPPQTTLLSTTTTVISTAPLPSTSTPLIPSTAAAPSPPLSTAAISGTAAGGTCFLLLTLSLVYWLLRRKRKREKQDFIASAADYWSPDRESGRFGMSQRGREVGVNLDEPGSQNANSTNPQPTCYELAARVAGERASTGSTGTKTAGYIAYTPPASGEMYGSGAGMAMRSRGSGGRGGYGFGFGDELARGEGVVHELDGGGGGGQGDGEGDVGKLSVPDRLEIETDGKVDTGTKIDTGTDDNANTTITTPNQTPTPFPLPPPPPPPPPQQQSPTPHPAPQHSDLQIPRFGRLWDRAGVVGGAGAGAGEAGDGEGGVQQEQGQGKEKDGLRGNGEKEEAGEDEVDAVEGGVEGDGSRDGRGREEGDGEDTKSHGRRGVE
ncbi:hypothetical protein IAQ61_004690 [Plenodomus lingam]|uniref:uncharacterized protein n=1 Tax=Leptosphaeria maculans TaxID=5022 RepID=UPI00332EF3F5|nr:hypothetical protein IAQ61_004690 [Plenodomus lingam]